ncbi:zinc finger, CCHC-type containing protein [Tanacetum coccineum]|uniref:Zinc finger, CCHC-type containing protein n=1 Tax=Tanacetum coccineum TaxID=301880 RepID=A0ABQ5APJ8_9ASTR
MAMHPAVIEGYSDANWISDIKDSRSTSGYVFTLEGAAISWKSSKQTVIVKSTMESEFIALDKCGEEAEMAYINSNGTKSLEGMSFYEGKPNLVDWRSQDLDEITYVREKWGRFEGNCGGAIPKSSCRKPELEAEFKDIASTQI